MKERNKSRSRRKEVKSAKTRDRVPKTASRVTVITQIGELDAAVMPKAVSVGLLTEYYSIRADCLNSNYLDEN